MKAPTALAQISSRLCQAILARMAARTSLIVCIVAVLLSARTEAQIRVDGQVRNEVFQPVAGAYIEFTNDESGEVWLTFSDAEGRYSILLGKISTAVTEMESTRPDGPLLWQNYPNPFNPSTTIRYSVARPGLVTLRIFNVLGQPVRTLVDSWQPTGRFQSRWDGANADGQGVGAGVYFYRLVSADGVQTAKMLLSDGGGGGGYVNPPTPASKAAQAGLYTIRVYPGYDEFQIEEWQKNAVRIDGDMSIDLTGPSSIPPFSSFLGVDLNGDGVNDFFPWKDSEAEFHGFVRDLDFDGNMDALLDDREAMAPEATKVHQRTFITLVDSLATVIVSVSTKGNQIGMSAVHLRVQADFETLGVLMGGDPLRLVPEIAEVREGAVVLKIPRALASSFDSIEVLGGQRVEDVGEAGSSDLSILWSFADESSHAAVPVTRLFSQRADGSTEVSFHVAANYILEAEDVRMQLVYPPGAAQELAGVRVEASNQAPRIIGGEAVHTFQVTGSFAPVGQGLHGVAIQLQSGEGIIFADIAWPLITP